MEQSRISVKFDECTHLSGAKSMKHNRLAAELPNLEMKSAKINLKCYIKC